MDGIEGSKTHERGRQFDQLHDEKNGGSMW